MKKADRFVPVPELYDLAFDQFSRQYQVKRLVEAVRTKHKLRILDVGGHNGKTREFFPGDEVLVADLYDIEEPGYLKASGLDLPFKDGAYDVVVCFDVFEHILPGDRERFLTEITRVARQCVVVAAPFDTEFVSQAEQELNAYYQRVTGQEHRWLREHIDNGLPRQEEIERFLEQHKLAYQTYNSNNILLWSGMQNLIFLADSVRAPERISSLNRYYNEHLPMLGDGSEPSYRRIYFAIKGGRLPERSEISEPVDMGTLRELINRMGVALHDMIYGNGVLSDQMQALAAKDRELEGVRHELQHTRNQLSEVLGSRSYRLATTLRRIKNQLVPRRRS